MIDKVKDTISKSNIVSKMTKKKIGAYEECLNGKLNETSDESNLTLSATFPEKVK